MKPTTCILSGCSNPSSPASTGGVRHRLCAGCAGYLAKWGDLPPAEPTRFEGPNVALGPRTWKCPGWHGARLPTLEDYDRER
jgi:hypothetical protein